MKLHELPKVLACSKATKRRGKGVGSGQGKTAGRGHKGGKARAGYSPAPCCSGIPFYRHLPIRGFSNARFSQKCTVVSLQKLAELRLGAVNKVTMKEFGLIRDHGLTVKILGGCVLSRPMIVIADMFSKSAAEEIRKAGGTVISPLDPELESE
ncbi:MAG: 50S ribosomal protein L15 [Puniceicoccales bacterium]|jgi:large subunit ribosomal protein L15|nr:50S ribosomal protein L15 [Puniceicoccales bacterium]